MRFIPVAKDLHSRAPVVRYSHNSAVGRPFKPLMACAVFALTLAGALGATGAQATTGAVGAVAGAAGVSATGAATYSIPISLPPGTNGMQPSVALSYDSQRGEGLAGFGWSLSGISAISRCNKTIEDNGLTQAVQFAASGSSDDFCLDGQHLILTGGSGFSNGSSYSTEIKNFSKINSYTDANATNGPSWFEIKTKDGRVYDYGNTTDSKIYAQGTTAVRVWALARVTDLNGNFYTLSYQNNGTTTGEYWPLSIDYTGNGGITPDHHVVFGYVSRPSGTVQAYYVHGSLITNSQRLSTITVKYGATPTFTYTLGYVQDAVNGRNQLTTVKECGSDGTCLPQTTIAWQNAQAGWGADTPTGASVSDEAHADAAHLMDVDGDGIQDLVYPDGNSGDWMVMFGQPGGGFGSAIDTGVALWGTATYYQYALTLDYNGDGREDLMVPIPTGWQMLVATGDRTPGQGGIFRTPPNSLPYLGANNSVTGLPIYEGNVWTADFSGQGLSDLVYTDGTTMWLVRNGGPASGNPQTFSSPEAIYTNNGLSKSVAATLADVPVDFDGSGRAGALALNSNTQTTPTTYTLEGFTSTEQPTFLPMDSVSRGRSPPSPVDANGDGLTDMLSVGPASSSNDWQISFSTGTAFVNLALGIPNDYSVDSVVADYYGDGRQVPIVWDSAGFSWDILGVNYVSGSGFSLNKTIYSTSFASGPYGQYAATYVPGSLRVGSIEASGLSDLVFAELNNGTYPAIWHYKLHNGTSTAFDVVTSITNGLGSVCQFAYASLASGTVYTKGSGAQYPIVDEEYPLQVVWRYLESDGTGTNYKLKYVYSGARFDTQGQGFLGFASRTITDFTRLTTETITYNQTFPWTGMVVSDTVVLTSDPTHVLISDIENTGPDELTTGNSYGTSYLPYFDTSTTKIYNYNGTASQTLRTTTSTLDATTLDGSGNHVSASFDAYGNVIKQQTTVLDGATGKTFTSNTTATYSADTSNYCVGLPSTETVTSTPPSGPAISRTTTSNLDTAHCQFEASATAATPSVTVSSSVQGSPTLSTSYTYDAFGNVSQSVLSGTDIDPALPNGGRTMGATFGGNGEFATASSAVVSGNLTLNSSATWHYDLGLKASDTDANSKKTFYDYDGFGRIATVTRPDGTKTQYSYAWCPPAPDTTCPTGVYEVITTQVGNDVNHTQITTGYAAYDMKGRVVRKGTVLLGGNMSLVDTTYDGAGNAVSVTRPYLSGQTPGFQTNYIYDDTFDRVMEIDAPANATETSPSSYSDKTVFSYNVTGKGYEVKTTHTVSGSTQITTRYTDALGEVLEMDDANGGTTTYTYDAFGDLTKTIDADQNITQLYYDGLGHKTSMTDPNMGQWTYQVDALGEVLCQTDANNQSIILTYDGLGRVTNKLATASGGGCNASTGTASSWTYDQPGALGLPASVSDSNGFQRAYEYDPSERPIDVTTTVSGTPYDVLTSYDNFSRVRTVTYPVSVTPATAGSAPVASITPGSGTVLQNVGINLNGSGSTDPNNLPLQYSWSQSSGPPGVSGTFTSPYAAQTQFSSAIPGNYTLQLDVSDADSAGTPATASVTVQPVAPGAPTAPSPNYNTGTVTVSWGNVSGADSYKLFKSSDGTTFTQIPGTINPNTDGSGITSTPVTSLTNGTYYFKVVACGNSVCGAQSPSSSAITVLFKPVAPTGLSSSAPTTSTTGSFTLNWTAPSGPVTNYQVYVSTTSGTTGFSPLGSPVTSASKPITGAADGNYWYYVTATNAAGTSPNSAVVAKGVLHPPGAPGTSWPSPNSVPTQTEFTLTWAAASGTVQYYIINGGSTHYTGLSATLTSPRTGGSKFYYVQACNVANGTQDCGPNSAASPLNVTINGGCTTCAPVNGGSSTNTTTPASHASGATAAPSGSTGGIPLAFLAPMPGIFGDALQPLLVAASVPVSKLPLLVRQPEPVVAHDVLAALAHTRQAYAVHVPLQASEAVVQAEASRRALEKLPSVLPPATAQDVAAWDARQVERMRQDPVAPTFEPPAYIAYGGARVETATNTPYQFQVQYNYDPSSGAIESVQNAQTKFPYWQASTGGGAIAPVDAYGHLLAYTDGNNVSTVLAYDAATAATTGISTGIGQSTAVQSLLYVWDGFGNLTKRCDANRNIMEKFTYDSLNRLWTSAVRTGVSSCGGGTTTATIGVSYDAIGNIQTLTNSGNSAVGGTYTYDPNHPYGVSTVSNIPGTYSYDANGNVTCRAGTGTGCTGGTAITWNADNLPTQITGPGGSSIFSYGPDMQRYQQVATDSSGTTTTTYIGSLFEVVTNGSGTEYRHNIMGPGGIVAVHTIDQGGNVQTNYIHSDHLGSSDTITADNGTVVQDMSFDAFGLRRDPNDWSYDLTSTQIAGLKGITDKGYTAQEQLDNVGLVHMNGRVYDPNIGRMISADPTVPNPMYSQAFNRYTYVYNNPLSATDPSGLGPMGTNEGSWGLPNSPYKYDGTPSPPCDLGCQAQEEADLKFGLSIDSALVTVTGEGALLKLAGSLFEDSPVWAGGLVTTIGVGNGAAAGDILGNSGYLNPSDASSSGLSASTDLPGLAANPKDPVGAAMFLKDMYDLFKQLVSLISPQQGNSNNNASNSGTPGHPVNLPTGNANSSTGSCTSSSCQLGTITVQGSSSEIQAQDLPPTLMGHLIVTQTGQLVFVVAPGQNIYGNNGVFSNNGVINNMNITDGAQMWDGVTFGDLSYGGPHNCGVICGGKPPAND